MKSVAGRFCYGGKQSQKLSGRLSNVLTVYSFQLQMRNHQGVLDGDDTCGQLSAKLMCTAEELVQADGCRQQPIGSSQ